MLPVLPSKAWTVVLRPSKSADCTGLSAAHIRADFSEVVL